MSNCAYPDSIGSPLTYLWGRSLHREAANPAGGLAILCSMLAPPGAGTSMLAQRLTIILPVMTLADAIDTIRIRSIAQVEDLLFEPAVEVDDELLEDLLDKLLLALRGAKQGPMSHPRSSTVIAIIREVRA
jgi:hypothetical protein